MGTSIQADGLVKVFGSTRALDGLDLSVHTGEVHGFLGPNGSGKSTTVRILLGLLKADAGSATVLGGDPWRDAVLLHRRHRRPQSWNPGRDLVRRTRRPALRYTTTNSAGHYADLGQWPVLATFGGSGSGHRDHRHRPDSLLMTLTESSAVRSGSSDPCEV